MEKMSSEEYQEYHLFKVGDKVALGGSIYEIISEYEDNIYLVKDSMGVICLAVFCYASCWDGLSSVISGVVVPIDGLPMATILNVLRRARC
ncbi:hypothetical protein [Acidianus two-tailed virus 2]|nr:hypothetical protein [Acidianus two-tailed virus 2]